MLTISNFLISSITNKNSNARRFLNKKLVVWKNHLEYRSPNPVKKRRHKYWESTFKIVEKI